jgi:hypothetical protein
LAGPAGVLGAGELWFIALVLFYGIGDNYCANFILASSAVVCFGYGFEWGAGGLTCDFAEGNRRRKLQRLKAITRN